jgi:hypothetical protein
MPKGTSSIFIRLDALIGGEPNILYGFAAYFRKSRAFANASDLPQLI